MKMIEINNQTKAKISKIFIQKVLNKALKLLKKKMNLSVAIVGPAKIKQLNKTYRKIDRLTDVLSFEELNEIIICYQQAKKQAKERSWPVKQEIKILLIHGLLHLLGYNHKTKKQKEKMDKLMIKLLSESNF
ncbi:MAG: rRNA maturation RNase YbeY [Patescibacteria group bacterium]